MSSKRRTEACSSSETRDAGLIEAYAGIDVAFAKKKKLPVVVAMKRGAILEPLELRRASSVPPAGEGNACILDAKTVTHFAHLTSECLQNIEKEFAVRIRRVAIDAPSNTLQDGKRRRHCEIGLDARRISCIATPSGGKFREIVNRGLIHLHNGGATSRLPGANQLWMLVGFALFEGLRQRWECIEVFPQAIAVVLNAHKIPKNQEEGLRAQLKAVSQRTNGPSNPEPGALVPIAYGAPHDKLDAYLAAWVASLDEEEREPIGLPPDDAIWVPRNPPRTISLTASP